MLSVVYPVTYTLPELSISGVHPESISFPPMNVDAESEVRAELNLLTKTS